MKRTDHAKMLEVLANSTDEKFVVHHRDFNAGRFNKMELNLQDNNKKHDTEYFKEKFIKNGFTEIKNKSVLEKETSNKKIAPFTGEGTGTRVEISSDSFGRTKIRVIIDKTKLEKNEVEKLEKAFKEKIAGTKKIKMEVKHPGVIESIKGFLRLKQAA